MSLTFRVGLSPRFGGTSATAWIPFPEVLTALCHPLHQKVLGIFGETSEDLRSGLGEPTRTPCFTGGKTASERVTGLPTATYMPREKPGPKLRDPDPIFFLANGDSLPRNLTLTFETS